MTSISASVKKDPKSKNSKKMGRTEEKRWKRMTWRLTNLVPIMT
jgi:hypothetical protein